MSCLSTFGVLVEVIDAGTGMAGAAPASMGVGPRIILDVVVLVSCGRTHSGVDSAAWVLPIRSSVIVEAGGEVIPLEEVEVVDNGGGVRAAGGLAKARTGVYCSGPGVCPPFRVLMPKSSSWRGSKMRASEASSRSRLSSGEFSWAAPALV